MPLNRRNEASFQSAIGRGCVSLIFTAVAGVGFSLAKVIVGSEYIHSCPSKDIIPVYVVVSGCLPVLLSSLRQPFEKGNHEKTEPKFDTRLAFITAIFGIVVNLAWLVAGTYLVVTTFQVGTICKPSSDNTVNAGHFVVLYNSTYSANDTEILLSASNLSSVDSVKNVNMTLDTGSDINSSGNEVGASRSGIKTNATSSINLMGVVENNVLKSNILYDNDERIVNFTETSDGLEYLRNSTCIVCDLTILKFALAVVVIDWIFVGFGLVYFCCYLGKFVSSLKNEFLLNA